MPAESARPGHSAASALELERVANHLGDLGAMAGDVAFQPAAAFLGRLRRRVPESAADDLGQSLRARPGASRRRAVRHHRRDGGRRFAAASRRSARTGPGPGPALRAGDGAGPLRGVGKLDPEWCESAGIVGVPARACGVRARRAARSSASASTASRTLPIATAWAGDVLAARWSASSRYGARSSSCSSASVAAARGDPGSWRARPPRRVRGGAHRGGGAGRLPTSP